MPLANQFLVPPLQSRPLKAPKHPLLLLPTPLLLLFPNPQPKQSVCLLPALPTSTPPPKLRLLVRRELAPTSAMNSILILTSTDHCLPAGSVVLTILVVNTMLITTPVPRHGTAQATINCLTVPLKRHPLVKPERGITRGHCLMKCLTCSRAVRTVVALPPLPLEVPRRTPLTLATPPPPDKVLCLLVGSSDSLPKVVLTLSITTPVRQHGLTLVVSNSCDSSPLASRATYLSSLKPSASSVLCLVVGR